MAGGCVDIGELFVWPAIGSECTRAQIKGNIYEVYGSEIRLYSDIESYEY